MHDEAFADATRPTPACVLCLPLLDYSIGHEVLLLRRRNPIVLLSPAHFFDLSDQEQARAIMEAVWICANTWRENRRQPFAWLKIRIWGWKIRNANFSLAIAEFRNYLDAGRTLPPLLPCDDNQGRLCGAPFLARLIQYLVRHMKKTEEEAMDYPFGQAQFHYFTHAENEGALRIKNADEVDFENYCEEQDAIEAARLAAEEAKKEATCPA